MEEALRRAGTVAGLDQIILTVGDYQAAAKKLYASLGFTVFGHEPAALKIGEVTVDEDLMVYRLKNSEVRIQNS
jgi:hypothetical protein